MEIVAVKNVVTQHQGAGAVTHKILTNDEGLGQAVWARLHGILQVHTPLAAIAQQLLKAGGVLWCADDEDVTDTRQHQGAQGVVNHGFVVHRQQLLAHRQGGGVQSGAGTSGEDDAFACGHGVENLESENFSQHAGYALLPMWQTQTKGIL